MKNASIYRRVFIASIGLLFICCANPERALKDVGIYPLHPFEEIDSVGNDIDKYRFLIVDSVEEGNKEQFKQIESYVKKNMDKDVSRFAKYTVVVYKESKKLNRNFRQTESDRLMWHGQDIVYSFEWDKGVFTFCVQYKDGRIIGMVRP